MEHILGVIFRFPFAQATIVFWAMRRPHAVSLVSRNDIGVRAAGGIGGKRIAQSLGPGDLSNAVRSMLPTRLDNQRKPGAPAAVCGCALG